jgi:transcriptional regulator with XRE-family HTH domain
MPTAIMSGRRGEQLKGIRVRCGLSARKVAELSLAVASEQGSKEFSISHARLLQIENDGSVPSVFKLFTLSAIYGVPMNELLLEYVELPNLGRLQHSLNVARTHLFPPENGHGQSENRSLPFRLEPNVSLEKTNLLSRMVEAWADISCQFPGHPHSTRCSYGWVGSSDYTMYPLIRPGSFVQIEKCDRPTLNSRYHTEYDRPIYFIELRSGFLCCWCEIIKGHLISIPHPLSPCRPQQYESPLEAEIVGRVTAVTIKIANSDCIGTARKAVSQTTGRAVVGGNPE